MTALPAEPWLTGPSDAPDAGSPDSAQDVCLSCGVVFAWRDGWDGECLECAVLSQEHLDGRHAHTALAVCRRCG